MQNFEKAAGIVPSHRQLEWQKTEFYAFCHFGMNTFIGQEWSDGTALPANFDPTDFDADQWVSVIKSGGMKGLILTCKHHDGFCLWPSKFTDYSVKNSPFMDGEGDVVKLVSDACRKQGIKFGIYLSPWDRHEKTYGEGEAYNEFYKNQLRELLTDYGDIFCVWLDGACGEGENGKRQEYDWAGWYALIRELQPDAVISVCGPDVRWVGNEMGFVRESEWSVVPSYYAINEFTEENSQKNEGKKFRESHKKMVIDMGSRKAIKDAEKLVWYPAEADVSIRPGWFYHKAEDSRVKDFEKLFKLYIGTVGANCNLLLNIPPDKRGQITDIDALSLDGLRRMLGRVFYENLSAGKTASASSELDAEHCADNILSDSDELYWQSGEGDEKPEIVIDLGEECECESIILRENIATGQQIESFEIQYSRNGRFKRLERSTVIGNKRIIIFKKPVITDRIKIKITSCRTKATLLSAEIYKSK